MRTTLREIRRFRLLSTASSSDVQPPHHHTTIALSCGHCGGLSHIPSSDAVHQRYCQGGRPQYLVQRRPQQQRTRNRVRETILKYESYQ